MSKPDGEANKSTQDITSKPDDLVEGSAKDKAELTESELKAVSGGAIYMKFDDIKGSVTTDGFKDWIE